jgi:serine/threonine protein kinase
VLGTLGSTGFVHDYVRGRPLGDGQPVPDGFFDQLLELLEELHRRQIAYVDTNKPQNILLGEDGRPHLIDFQISYDLHELGDNPINRWILRRLQRADIYHALKHKRRLRPDELTDSERLVVTKVGWPIRLHRIVAMPYFKFRRRTFRRLRDTGQLLPEGSK